MYGALFSSDSSFIDNAADATGAGSNGAYGVAGSQQPGDKPTRSGGNRETSGRIASANSRSDASEFQPRPSRQTPPKDVSPSQHESNATTAQNGTSISVDAEAIWQAARSQLAMQMPAATYDTWMRDTKVVAYEDGEFIIGIPNAYVRDWLENRLRNKIKKTLSTLLGRSVQINFRVVPPTAVNEPERSFAPLYEQQAENGSTPYQKHGQSHTQSGYAQTAVGSDDPIEAAQGLPQTLLKSETLDDNYLYGQGAATQESVNAAPHNADNPIESDPAGAHLRDSSQTATDWRGTMHSPGMLNPAHTFVNFVVGNHNRLAHAAAQAIAETPGQSFNPLFVYGGVGLGKTHLLHAVGNQARQRGFRLLYCSSEQFTHELIMAIRSQSTEDFRNKYRQVDMLLIDDIQFIGGKESTQEEFFHTFNYLHAAGRQVVLSSDRPPKALATLDDRLRSRFEGGLQTDISQPDFETRVAILQSKALKTDLRIHRDVLMLIAERVESNVRELEGVLNRMVLQARLFSSSLDLALAENILRNLAPQRTPRSPSIVIRVVAEFYHLQPEDLTGRTRTKDIAHARQVAMYLLREENALSLPAIGDHLGGRDHSTVRYGVDKITGDLDDDETLRREVTTLREKIYMEPGL